MAEIHFHAVQHTFPGAPRPAVANLDLEIGAGELVVLLGESGSGKTTTLKMINRLLDPTGGRIDIDGRPASSHDPIDLRRHIGYVFQHIGLFPHLSVARNIAVVPELLGWPPPVIAKRVQELLDLVGLTEPGLAQRQPRDLSGGQQQRVGVARALAARPGILLMDEPFAALDPLTRGRLQEEIRSIHRRFDLTSVLVTHDMTEALLLADRIVVLKDGRTVQVGTPKELLTRPASAYVEALLSTPRSQAERVKELTRP